MVKALAALIVLLTASMLQAQTFALKVFSRSCDQNSCRQMIGYGTACYLGQIDDRSVFVTASHNLDNATHSFIYDGNKYHQMTVRHRVYEDRKIENGIVKPLVDYALIDCERISFPKCFTLSEELPPDGTYAQADGCYMDSGRMTRLNSVIRVNRNGRFFMKSVTRGQSGGPIVANNSLVGVIHGAYMDGNKETIFTDSQTIKAGLVKVYGRIPQCNCRPVVVNPVPTEPLPVPVNDSQQLAALQGELSKLREQLDLLSKTQIPVQIIGADGKVVTEQKYPLGDPIKLRFKAVKK
tara:strand:+ start:3080 stop:3964 length:885 start_codon:yes stop_codon:yes gene_type:complete